MTNNSKGKLYSLLNQSRYYIYRYFVATGGNQSNKPKPQNYYTIRVSNETNPKLSHHIL